MSTTTAPSAPAENPNKLFPLIINDDLPALKAFYVDVLGAKLRFDLDTYLQVELSDDDDGPELAFMRADSFPPPARQPVFNGEGLIISIPTADADATCERCKAAGAQVLAPPADKPWGWRSFWVRDPSGVILDYFHVISEPVADA